MLLSRTVLWNDRAQLDSSIAVSLGSLMQLESEGSWDWRLLEA
jgi:hypothetical protein